MYSVNLVGCFVSFSSGVKLLDCAMSEILCSNFKTYLFEVGFFCMYVVMRLLGDHAVISKKDIE